jgi:hypothetical protein
MTTQIISQIVRVKGETRLGYLTGTTKNPGDLADMPVRRVVQLFESAKQKDVFITQKALIAQTWSSPDGIWRFDGISENKRYAVIAYDHTGQYDPVVKINLIPTVPE